MRLLILAGVAGLALSLSTGALQAAESQNITNALPEFIPVKPGSDDGRVAWVTAELLEKAHYSHHPLDAAYSSAFLDRYLEALDPQHMHFVQADLNEFEIYRTNLDSMTINRARVADTSAAYAIFDRFARRLRERIVYSDELLRGDKFDFTSDERAVLNRRELPYPKTLDEARQLWRQRVRFEYLQEKLALEGTKKPKSAKTSVPAPKTGKGESARSENTRKGTPPTAAITSPAKSVREQIVDTLIRRYHRTWRMVAEWNNQDVMGIYLTALAHVYDPHSDYFNPEQIQGFSISMNLALFGIGAELISEDDYCKIRRLLPGGPAFKSKKLNDEDRIVAVAQGNDTAVDVVGMSLNKVVQLIRGPKGSEVRLTITSAASPERREVRIIRDEIPLEDSSAKARLIEMPKPGGGTVRLGLIDLPSFYASMNLPGSSDHAEAKSTTTDVTKLVKKLEKEKISGLILDLRRNGGGSLEEAIRLTGLFIKQGPVVQVVPGPNGGAEVDSDNDPSLLYGGPLMVLTSRFSASASEIVAGALQDYGRALIVGDISTHGKGTVQNLNPLRAYVPLHGVDTNDTLKVTIRKFYRPSGSSTQLKGVLPDIVLPSEWNYSKDVGESSLENPLPWDTIPSAKFDKLDLVQPYLSALLNKSNERIATNQDFGYKREDIELFRKQQEDKSVSLNEKTRLKEIHEKEVRDKGRDRERRGRKPSMEKVYELTLKLADLPGLPAPLQVTNALASVHAGPEAPATAQGEDGEETPPPAVDITLREAQNILVDYLSALPQGGANLARHN